MSRNRDDDFYLDDEADEVAECISCGRIYDRVYNTTNIYKDRSGNYLCGRCMD